MRKRLGKVYMLSYVDVEAMDFASCGARGSSPQVRDFPLDTGVSCRLRTGWDLVTAEGQEVCWKVLEEQQPMPW